MNKQNLSNSSENLVLNILTRYYYVFLLFLFAVVGFFVFYNLGALPALPWDEARHGVSAYEMLQNNNYIVNTYGYANDYYNLKPPLSFWSIIGGYKIFGFNLFGMRFYSALSYFVMTVMIAFFIKKRYGCLESLLTALLFACCTPFYMFHFARHADADAMFVLFATLSVLAALMARDTPKYFWLCGLFFSLAFLTKSWHTLFIVAVVGMYFIVYRLFNKFSFLQWSLFLLASAIPILIWAVIRYQYDGMEFFSQMFTIDLFNRTSQALEGHVGGIEYYLVLLFQLTIAGGILFACVGLYTLIMRLLKKPVLSSESVLRKDILFYLIWIFVPFILFSLVQTKIQWYLYPILVPVLILTALLAAAILKGKKGSPYLSVIRRVLVLLIAVAVSIDFYRTWDAIRPYEDGGDTIQEYLTEELSQQEELHNLTAYWEITGLPNPKHWEQGHFLLAELSGNLKCQDGGMEAFLQHNGKALILATGDICQQNADALANYQIVGEKDGLYCILKE